ncbi:MAG: chemotaxis-specific protein-glutamate methyltransferase CheB [Haloferacaceae archaeon]
MTGATRAVVVDDSHFMRTVVSDILEDGGIDVVATASDGAEAVDAVAEHAPDVVTMDVEMPNVNGIEAVERIMADRPTPVLMLSAHTDDGADVTFEALEKGAVDFFTKPGGEVSTKMSTMEDQLVRKVKSVAGATVSGTTRQPSTETTRRDGYDENVTVVVASSTGGPTVVEEVVGSLPLEANLRVFVVQHMPNGFTGRFADRLDAASEYAVREASDGDRVSGGEILVAAGGTHLSISGYARGRARVKLTDDPPVHGVRPAADVTMQSAAEQIDDPLVGVVLTGMGGDGAAGVEEIGRAGGHVVAQDEDTSAVFGMPKRAIETGYVDDVRPVGEIPDAILDSIEREATV